MLVGGFPEVPEILFYVYPTRDQYIVVGFKLFQPSLDVHPASLETCWLQAALCHVFCVNVQLVLILQTQYVILDNIYSH